MDRINEKISYLYRPLHPGVLRLIAMTAKAANENGIEVGVCGEMAGTAGMAPVLCGLGVTNLSMSASAMLAAKADLAKHSCGECKERETYDILAQLIRVDNRDLHGLERVLSKSAKPPFPCEAAALHCSDG